mgnify:FL=1
MVEITPTKPKLVTVTWRWPLWVAVALFLAAAAAFIGFRVYLNIIQTEVLSVNNQIKTEAAKVSVEDENTIAGLSDTLRSFTGMVNSHAYFSEFFSRLEALTNKRVAFTRFDANTERNFIQLGGVAQNYTTLARQMVAFRESEYVKGVEVRRISFNPTGLEFELSVTVDPKIFK